METRFDADLAKKRSGRIETRVEMTVPRASCAVRIVPDEKIEGVTIEALRPQRRTELLGSGHERLTDHSQGAAAGTSHEELCSQPSASKIAQGEDRVGFLVLQLVPPFKHRLEGRHSQGGHTERQGEAACRGDAGAQPGERARTPVHGYMGQCAPFQPLGGQKRRAQSNHPVRMTSVQIEAAFRDSAVRLEDGGRARCPARLDGKEDGGKQDGRWPSGRLGYHGVRIAQATPTASTSCTSGMKCLRRFWIPYCSVAVEDGQPAQAPRMFRYTVPSL